MSEREEIASTLQHIADGEAEGEFFTSSEARAATLRRAAQLLQAPALSDQDQEEPCGSCNGIGLKRQPDGGTVPTFHCPTCKGTGKKPKPDPQCEGGGEVGTASLMFASITRKGRKGMNGAELIAAERERQVSEEGWSPEHDDDHADGSLRRAAICYARLELGGGWDVPNDWPWEPESWKPRDDITCLVKAGALIAAEIDRLQRAGGREA